MNQIINSILIGFIVLQMLNNDEKYKGKSILKLIIIMASTVIYYSTFYEIDSVIMIYGPGGFLLVYIFISYIRKKRNLKEK
jgi:hypothetical protein